MEHWGSRLGALLALIGGAIGLGNFLRFPFQAAKWGGGAFLVPYGVALVVVGLPLVWAEITLGRLGAQFQKQSAPTLLASLKGKKGWYVGLLSVYVSLGIGAYYAYLMGWTLGYAYHGIIGTFESKSLEEIVSFHAQFVRKEAWFFWIFSWIITAYILYRGLQGGVEKINLYGMPLLFLSALAIAIGTVALGETGRCPDCSSWAGIQYLYVPQWKALLQPAVWLAATGQVLFSIGVGFGMYPVYAASWKKGDIVKEGSTTVLANTFAEVVLGGLIVIPLVTAFLGLGAVQKRAGFSMGFEVMPYVLTEWGGRALVVIWYILLFLTAITSLIAMGWVGVTWLAGVLGGSPQKWTWAIVGLEIVLGAPSIAGYEVGTLDLYDQWLGSIFLVIAAMGHWYLFQRSRGWQVLVSESYLPFPGLWHWILRWVTPIFLAALFVGSIVQPQDGDWIGAIKAISTGKEWPWAQEALPLWLSHSLKETWNQVGLLLLSVFAGLMLFLRQKRN
ncbi:MAG: sodium-dependent transporter [Bacteroidia bacterium]|nr:sodium-dependent transporter [Bacteroidia bacterium]MDW8133867.1 sodium-dependent transporter [Bacteroidia bacterium]